MWSSSSIYTCNSGAPLAITGSGCPSDRAGHLHARLQARIHKESTYSRRLGQRRYRGECRDSPLHRRNCFRHSDYLPDRQPGAYCTYNLFGPSKFDMDAGLSRRFEIAEGVTFILDATSTNVFNNVIFEVGGLAANGIRLWAESLRPAMRRPSVSSAFKRMPPGIFRSSRRILF